MKDIDFSRLEAYDLIDRQPMEALGAVGFLLCHKRTKAKVALVLNDDNNKVFNIAFRTPCKDDTGVPHIIEHSVLCGSKKYPVKDPFVELAKGSLNTYLNATTYTAKTMYPLASVNEADFKNIMDVYLDAVFNPNIYTRKEIFMQEGWSYKMDSLEDELQISGVVYNEMKGAFSSPERVVYATVQHAMNPDNQFAYESGGDPEKIPDLTYEEFLAFHQKYYHPSNSIIFLYGDVDAIERLEYIDREYLSHYDYLQVDAEVLDQKPFDQPVQVRESYAIGQDEDEQNKAYIAYASTFGSGIDVKLSIAMDVLDYALLSMPGAPVKQAIIDAGLAKDVYGGGTTYKDNAFMIVAKGANEADKDQLVKVIEDTLRRIVDEGIDRDSLRAALNILEFRYREADFGNFPKGIYYSIDVIEALILDDKRPFALLDASDAYVYLNSVVDTGYFETLIEQFILDNNTKAIVTVAPKKGMVEEQEQTLADKLKTYRASLDTEQLEAIVADTKHLLEYQSEPSTKEELETIPMLKLTDIDTEAAVIEYEKKEAAGVPVIHSNMGTNNVAYITASFDTAGVPEGLVPYMGLLKSIMGYVATEYHDYATLNNIINLYTGGMTTELAMYSDVKEKDKYSLRFDVKVKVFYERIAKALELFDEILMHTRVDDAKRIKDIIGEIKASQQSKAANSGYTIAINRAMSYYLESMALMEKISGVDYMTFIDDIYATFDSRAEEIMANIRRVIELIFTKDNLNISFTGDDNGYMAMTDCLQGFVDGLGQEATEPASRHIVVEQKNEGLKISSQVQYVARAGSFKLAGYEYTGTWKAFENVMEYGYLWEHVRVKGGAYGCFAAATYGGNVYLCSYRDPNLAKTNDIFQGIPAYLRSFDESDRNILKYIIGTISYMDRPKTPRAKGEIAYRWYMCGIDMDMAQAERDAVLSLSNEKLHELADVMEAVLSQGNICVVGSGTNIEAAGDLFKETRSLLK